MDIATYNNYQVSRIPYKVQELSYSESLSEILTDPRNEKPITGTIILILSTYLPANVKSKAITTTEAINMICDFFINECSNLELTEIEWIIRAGIMGRLGTIYNDISIDTICGIDGWVETYYKLCRPQRPEPKNKIQEKFSGKEITEAEFLERNPEFKERVRLRQLLELAKGGKITSEHAKEFYKLKGLTLDDVKEDMTVYSHNYFALPESQREIFTESQFINHHHCKFIIDNVFKSKK